MCWKVRDELLGRVVNLRSGNKFAFDSIECRFYVEKTLLIYPFTSYPRPPDLNHDCESPCVGKCVMSFWGEWSACDQVMIVDSIRLRFYVGKTYLCFEV